MSSECASCLEVLLQLPGWQVELVEALQERPDAHKAVVLDLHHAPNQRLQLALDHNHLPRHTAVSACPCIDWTVATCTAGSLTAHIETPSDRKDFTK